MERILSYKDFVKDTLQSSQKPAVFQRSILTSGVLTDEDSTYADRIYSPGISNFRKDARDCRLEFVLIFIMVFWSLFSNFLWHFKIEINFIMIISILILWISPYFFERPLTTNMEFLFGLTTIPPVLILLNLLSFFHVRILLDIPVLSLIVAFFIYKVLIIIGFFYHHRLLKAVVEEEIQTSRLIKALTNIDYFSTIKKAKEVHLKHLEVRENIVENLKGKVTCFRLMKDLISQITI